MPEGLLQMRSRPLRQRGLFSVPVDEDTRSVLLPFAEREGEFSFALPQAAIEAYESFTLPGQAMRGELGAPGSPEMVQGATRFGVDYGMLPALAGGLLTPSPNTLRMGMGGADTVSGGARRGPEVDELGFYSKALETARMLPQEKGTGEQFRSMLTKAGVKEDELKFTPGLEGLLSQPKVTRDELVGLLEESRIRPEETVFFADDASEFDKLNFPSEPEVLDVYDAYGRHYVREEVDMILDDPENASELLAKLQGYPQERIDELAQIIDEEGIYSDKISSMEEGDLADVAEAIVNERYSYDPVYRLQDPDTGYEIIGSEESGYHIADEEGRFVGEPNISSLDEARVQADYIARESGLIGYEGGEGGTRFMEYTESGGSNYREMLLQVPEYEGMTDEFIATGHFDEPNIVVHARTKDRSSDSGTDDVLYIEELQSDWGQRGRDRGFRGSESNKKQIEEVESKIDELEKLRKKYSDQSVAYVEDYKKRLGIEDAEMPYAALQDLRRFDDKYEAIYQNFQSADREYDGYLRELQNLRSTPPQGPLVGSSEKFAEVGIKRLINRAAKEGKRYVTFSPGEVQADRWNNEGLKTFYDKIIPKVGKKVAGRLDKDARVGYLDDVRDDRFSIEITDKMREEALRGQPLFMAPAVPTGAGGLLGDDRRVETVEDFYRAGIL